MDEMTEEEKRIHDKLVMTQMQLADANARNLVDSLDAIRYRSMYTSGKMAGKAFVLAILSIALLNFMLKNEVLQQLGFVTDNTEVVGYPDTLLEVVMCMIIGILFIPMIQHWSGMSRKRIAAK